jgi:hypothetical protein
MTRIHAARCLLKLGPLSFQEFVCITGWPKKQARNTIKQMQRNYELNNAGQKGKYAMRLPC